MEEFKVRFCRLCLDVVDNENYVLIEDDTKDILGVHLFKVHSGNETKYVVCNVCSAKLLAAQRFKMTCLCTDNSIITYVGDTTVLPLDLREIYEKERSIAHVSDNVKICRLCMEPVYNILDYETVNEEHVNMILKFIPGMNIFTIKEPVICNACRDSLAEHSDNNFLKQCSDEGRNIGNTSSGRITDAPSPVPSLHTAVKMEDVDIKFEDIPLIKKECNDVAYEEMNTESEIVGQENSSKEPAVYNLYQYENCNVDTIPEIAPEDEDPLAAIMYKCKMCDFKSKYKRYVKIHLQKHNEPSEVQMYRCKTCNYETKDKYYLKTHEIIHKDPSEVRIHKCKICTFETKHKSSLRNHILTHKDTSEVQIYKCQHCHFTSRFRGSLRKHIVKHNPSQVQMYKCENCDYQTKYINYFNCHMLVHKYHSENANVQV